MTFDNSKLGTLKLSKMLCLAALTLAACDGAIGGDGAASIGANADDACDGYARAEADRAGGDPALYDQILADCLACSRDCSTPGPNGGNTPCSADYPSVCPPGETDGPDVCDTNYPDSTYEACDACRDNCSSSAACQRDFPALCPPECTDSDSDSICDSSDNCPKIAYPYNYGCPANCTDANNDGSCDSSGGGGCTDTDGDKICNEDDNCPKISYPTNNGCPANCTDANNDGTCDSSGGGGGGCTDTDGDGKCNSDDACPKIASSNSNGCPTGCTDANNDGTCDSSGGGGGGGSCSNTCPQQELWHCSGSASQVCRDFNGDGCLEYGTYHLNASGCPGAADHVGWTCNFSAAGADGC